MAGKMQSVMFLAATIAVIFAGVCSAATFNVGGATNWTDRNLPSTSFYSTWASQQNFQVGDILVFNFPPTFHTVAMVSKASYDTCNTANFITRATTPPVRITLNTTGTQYFICTMPGHCNLGQKLAVTVSAAGPSSSPAPQPSAATPTTTPTTTTTPSPSSSTQSPPSPTTGVAPASPSGAAAATPPAGNFAAPTTAGVGVLSLVSVAAVALFF